MPEPPGPLQPQAPVAEVMAWHYWKDGDAPVWSAVRQAIADELSWEPGRPGFSPGDLCNLTLGAHREGSYFGLCRG